MEVLGFNKLLFSSMSGGKTQVPSPALLREGEYCNLQKSSSGFLRLPDKFKAEVKS